MCRTNTQMCSYNEKRGLSTHTVCLCSLNQMGDFLGFALRKTINWKQVWGLLTKFHQRQICHTCMKCLCDEIALCQVSALLCLPQGGSQVGFKHLIVFQTINPQQNGNCFLFMLTNCYFDLVEIDAINSINKPRGIFWVLSQRVESLFMPCRCMLSNIPPS